MCRSKRNSTGFGLIHSHLDGGSDSGSRFHPELANNAVRVVVFEYIMSLSCLGSAGAPPIRLTYAKLRLLKTDDWHRMPDQLIRKGKSCYFVHHRCWSCGAAADHPPKHCSGAFIVVGHLINLAFSYPSRLDCDIRCPFASTIPASSSIMSEITHPTIKGRSAYQFPPFMLPLHGMDKK